MERHNPNNGIGMTSEINAVAEVVSLVPAGSDPIVLVEEVHRSNGELKSTAVSQAHVSPSANLSVADQDVAGVDPVHDISATNEKEETARDVVDTLKSAADEDIIHELSTITEHSASATSTTGVRSASGLPFAHFPIKNHHAELLSQGITNSFASVNQLPEKHVHPDFYGEADVKPSPSPYLLDADILHDQGSAAHDIDVDEENVDPSRIRLVRSASPSPSAVVIQEKINEERILLDQSLNVPVHQQGSPSASSSHAAASGGTGAPSDGRLVDSVGLVRWWLYLAEVFGRWGDRMWTFTAALFLLELFPGSLLLPAIHGFVTGSCVILAGSSVGEWVDATSRKRAVRIALFTQNSCVAMGSLILTFAFVFIHDLSWSGRVMCVVAFMIFAIVADCASVAMNIIVEKDWVVVIAGGNRRSLADLNATIRRIDLTCQILSPIIIAQVMTFSEHYVGTIVVSVWNVLSMLMEYWILMKIYGKVPQLRFKFMDTPSVEKLKKPLVHKVFKSCFAIADGWRLYFKTPVWTAGLALAFLYMTVMAFGGVTNTYIRTQGLSESVISLMMALGAAVGIGGTFLFPKLREKVGLERTGLFALAAQLTCLTFCVVSIWLPGSPFDPYFDHNQTLAQMDTTNRTATGIDDKAWITKPANELPSVIVFLFGMIAARFGLWMADLTITQLIQENVSERERGVIGGVQSSFNRFMDMLKFILVICLPYPQTFGILIIVSFAFVFTGHCFYACHAYKSRGHLLPHFKSSSKGIVVINSSRTSTALHDGYTTTTMTDRTISSSSPAPFTALLPTARVIQTQADPSVQFGVVPSHA